jgi:aspartate-semialdehyde dehydrogenase
VTHAVQQNEVICGDLRAHGPCVTAWLLADGLRVGGAGAVVELVSSLTAS